jgi:hypothetical protein
VPKDLGFGWDLGTDNEKYTMLIYLTDWWTGQMAVRVRFWVENLSLGASTVIKNSMREHLVDLA